MTCRKSTILVILWTMAVSAMAQTAMVRQGDLNFKRFDFVAAAENYRTAMTNHGNDLSIREKLARTYVILEDHMAAEEQYAAIVKMPAVPAIDKLYYGLELRANGHYDAAQKAFNEYLAAAPDDARAKELAGSIDKVKPLGVDSKIYEVVNLKDINTEASDMAATFYKDGIVFSSNRGKAGGAVAHSDAWSNRSFYDLYSVRGEGNAMSSPLYIKGKQPNRKFHEGPATFSADGKEMYFTRTNYVKSKVKRSNDKTVKLQIMHADWDEAKQQWVNVKPILLNNSEYSTAHPALSKDGKRLFFISDMPGGQGETDLYVSYREPGKDWGPAVNLGKGVNTRGREMFPFSADENTLYFSSDGLTGLGGLDVYSASFSGGKWGSVQDLGTPVNSKWDDFAYIVNAKNNAGYFTSNRESGKGGDDIYKFTRNGVTICGTVVDAQTKDPLSGSDVKLTEGDNLITQKQAGEKGEFCFTALPNKKYKVSADKKEYEANSTSVSTGKSNQVIQIPLSKIGGIDLSVCVKQYGGSTLVGATVELTNKMTGKKQTCLVTAACKCQFDLEANSDYSICAYMESANAKGSYTHPCKNITTRDKVSPASLYESLDITYLEENMTVKIENLYYDMGKWAIRPDATIELDKVVALMNEFPGMEIELSSHTDCRGTIKSNDDLSAKRAKSCVDYLAQHGIDKNRMLAVGYGERKLVNGCACEGNVKSKCTDEQHQVNRRTEFKILKLK
ncbi:MAG: OmpA/MotB domain protein [Bacteroidetes bacterium]|nr:OmpA/MotB domain protein [Bacteroidota bacterium]